MIEVIYNEEGEVENEKNPFLHLPKNIRQIGDIEGNKKIYIEDYVVTYVHQLCREEDVIPKAAVLLGKTVRSEGVTYIFIEGAVEAENIEINSDGVQFTEEIWTGIYGKTKKYFDTKEIIGWYLGVNGFSLGITGDILNTHIDNFAGTNKVFMMYELTENEDGFFLFENGDLIRQKGFYVYYAKNQPMQDYMISQKKELSADIAERLPKKVESFRRPVPVEVVEEPNKRLMSFMYAASTFLVMIVLVIGVTMINNYDKMKNMEESLSVISKSAQSKTPDKIPVEEVESGIDQEDAKKPEDTSEQEMAEKPQETANTAPEVPSKQEDSQIPQIPETYVIGKGETLASISRKFYGNSDKVSAICEVNGITDSNQVEVGQKIVLPQ